MGLGGIRTGFTNIGDATVIGEAKAFGNMTVIGNGVSKVTIFDVIAGDASELALLRSCKTYSQITGY